MTPNFVVYSHQVWPKAYGRLSVISQRLRHVERLFDVDKILSKCGLDKHNSRKVFRIIEADI